MTHFFLGGREIKEAAKFFFEFGGIFLLTKKFGLVI